MLFETHFKNQVGKFFLFYFQSTFYLGKDIVTKHTQEEGEDTSQICPLHVSMLL
jgi:hypothetical protein